MMWLWHNLGRGVRGFLSAEIPRDFEVGSNDLGLSLDHRERRRPRRLLLDYPKTPARAPAFPVHGPHPRPIFRRFSRSQNPVVAAGILPAVEPRPPARRKVAAPWPDALELVGTRSGGKMPALHGRQDACRYGLRPQLTSDLRRFSFPAVGLSTRR